MLVMPFALAVLLSATDVQITEPEHCAAYNLDELPAFRAIVQNENEIPDSVHYSLNGADVVSVSRLSTDWHTYMQSYAHHGYSESPAPTDNTILWTAPVTGDAHEFPTPVVVNGVVYYPSNAGTDSLYALDAATGDLIWKYHTGATDDAVTVVDGRLYTASDSIWCLDALTGDRIWASGDGTWGGSTPVVIDGSVFCGTAVHMSPHPDTSWVVCLDINDGSLKWSVEFPGVYTACCIAPWNDLIIVPTSSVLTGGTDLAPLYALDAVSGSIVWLNDDAANGYWDSSPVIVDDVMYIAGCDGKVRGIDLASGSTIWDTAISIPDEFPSATPAYYDGKLCLANQGENYYCLDATSAGDILWSVPGDQHGSSAIADGMVFYGDNMYCPDYGRIRALSCETGEEIWSYVADSSVWIAGSPSIVDGIVYMPMHDWNLYAFGTGLKYTYTGDQLNSVVGWNELVATSYDGGEAVACDTISYYINQTGIEFGTSIQLDLACSPNPCFSGTTISFSLNETGFTSVSIYDLSGRQIDTLVNSNLSAGSHTISWDGNDSNDECVSSGLYICRIASGGVVETMGLCVLR